jgi:hypothetical protein
MQLTLSELKIPLTGAACALVAGLLLGSAMQPHLADAEGRPEGPQMFASWNGQSTGPFDPGVTLANYPGKMPDYVMGSDWKKAMASPDERVAVSAPREVVRDDDTSAPDAPALTRVAYEEPAAPAHAYPSLGGARSASDAAVDDDSLPAEPDTGR